MIILARGIKPMANKKVTPFMVGLLACVTLTGCSESGTQLLFENEPDTKDAYYSDVALSATEYSIFIEGIKTKINSYGMTLVSNVTQYKSAADKESVLGNIAVTKENLEHLLILRIIFVTIILKISVLKIQCLTLFRNIHLISCNIIRT